MKDEKFFVTGAFGCLGAWTLKRLVTKGLHVVASDLPGAPIRPRLILDPEELDAVEWVELDVTDRETLFEIIHSKEITRIIHLAALQVPFCRADPIRGAQVNVVGSINMLEAARKFSDRIRGLAYASSVAVFGPPQRYGEGPLDEDERRLPETLYGVYKKSNEESAAIYWADWKVASVGLRPSVVYGVGRDQGLTSDLARAILAAAARRPFRIQFDGSLALQYAPDVADAFIDSALAAPEGAVVCNLRNDVTTVSEFVDSLRQIYPEAQTDWNRGHILPFPSNLDDSRLQRLLGGFRHIPMAEGIAETGRLFERLLSEGRLKPEPTI